MPQLCSILNIVIKSVFFLSNFWVGECSIVMYLNILLILLLNPSIQRDLIWYIFPFLFITCVSDYQWKCEALLCYNYKNSNSQISALGLGPFPTVPGIHGIILGNSILLKSLIPICLMSIAGKWHDMYSESSVPLSSWSHCAGGIIKIHSDSGDYSIHFRRLPFSFHP